MSQEYVFKGGMPGVERPWSSGDRARFIFPGGTQWTVTLDATDAGEFNASLVKDEDGVVLPLSVRVVPEALLEDDGMKDMMGLLQEAGGELHIEHLEHRWTEMQKHRDPAPPEVSP